MSRNRVGRGLLICALDVVVAGAVAFFVWRQFGVWSQIDTQPPICENASGDSVACSADGVMPLVALGLFVTLLFGSIWVQRRRGII